MTPAIGLFMAAMIVTAGGEQAAGPAPPLPQVTAPAPPPPPPADIRVSAESPADEAAIDAAIATASTLLAADRISEATAMVETATASTEARYGQTSPELIKPLGALARLRQEQGRYTDALDLLDRALAIAATAPVDPVREAQLRYDQAKAYDALGRNEEAETAAWASYELRRVHLGQVQEKTADALNLYANALSAQGRHAEADPAYRQVLGMYEVLHGPKDFHLAIVLSNLGNSLRRTGRGRQANPLYRRAVSVAEVSGDKVLLAQCLTNYGWYLHTQGDGAKSETQFRRALILAVEVAGPDHPFTGVVHGNIGYALMDQGRYAEAEPEFALSVRLLEAGLGPDSPDIVDGMSGHAIDLARLGHPDEAEALFRRVRLITTTRLSPSHSDRLDQSDRFATFLLSRDRPDEALEELRSSLAALIGQEADGQATGGRDWRTSVRGAGPLFERRVEASWRLAAVADGS
jgi:tetratricopeptide (TPR) repeat protein